MDDKIKTNIIGLVIRLYDIYKVTIEKKSGSNNIKVEKVCELNILNSTIKYVG